MKSRAGRGRSPRGPADQPCGPTHRDFPALAFDGSDLLNIPSLVSTYNNFTVLVAAQSGTDWRKPQALIEGTRPDGPAVYQNDGGILYYYDQDKGGGIFAPYTTQSPIQGEVNTIAFASGPGTATFAVNGIPVNTGYAVGNSAGTTWNGWAVGNNTALQQGYKGNIYWVGIWNRQLSPAEIRQANATLRTNYPLRSDNFDPNQTRFVLAGASLLYGVGALSQDKTGWQVAKANANIPTKQFINVSTGGRTVGQSQGLLSEEVFPEIPAGSDTVLVSNLGGNDIRLAGRTGQQAYDSIIAYCNAVKAARPGVRIAWITMLPSESGPGIGAERLALNSLLMTDTTPLTGLVYTKANAPFDYVLDMASDADLSVLDTLDPGADQLTDEEWAAKYNYTRDRLHLTDKGYAIWAGQAKILFEQTYRGSVVAPEPPSLVLWLVAAASATAGTGKVKKARRIVGVIIRAKRGR